MTTNALPRCRVGRTALEVTRIGLGTAFLLGLDTVREDAPAIATVRAALDQGINFIDTAALYSRGQAERVIGDALQGVPRDRFVIQTKAGRFPKPDGGSYHDYSRDAILRSVENSMKLLGVDRLDSVLVHDADGDKFNRGQGVGLEDTYFRDALDHAFPTLLELRSQGVIGAVGAGMNQWQMEWEFAKHVDVDCFLLAGRYTLLEQTSLDFLEYCRQRNIAVFLGGVFNSGILATGPREGARYNYAAAPAHVIEKAAKIDAVCARYGVPLRVAALHFAMAHPAVTSVVLGAQKPEEVEANVAASRQTVPAALWADLKREGLIAQEAPTPA
ncbi:MAG: oxidoreductase [Candidatus Roseilinea sp.]|jgi:D-threo-aldose 1-dehydrogenase|nr:MAG: oxidoreductase [Candidatus Roseilinea sp.]